ncbi:MAG: CehA/McbA family metallohydrolase [Verrucomicrobiales bacterium]|nr:CehA/McbA family metallohydrolase [Verrucomicrobiales bacterium]
MAHQSHLRVSAPVRAWMRLAAVGWVVALAWLQPLDTLGVEAFQVGPTRWRELPGGKEADGVVGDFVMRNARVEAVVAQGAADRRANWTTYIGQDGTPGSLYDLSLRGRDNDHLTLFAPSNLRGPVAHVRVVRDGTEGDAVVETVIDAAMNEGLAVRHTYVLREDWQGLLILTNLRNTGREIRRFETGDRWRTLSDIVVVRGTTVGDASDPADKCAYAYRWFEGPGWVLPEEEVTVAAGVEVTFARGLVVADSPAAAFGVLASYVEGTAPVRGSLRNERGMAVTTARVEIRIADQWLAAYPDARGNLQFPLPFGDYDVRILDAGRAPVTTRLVVQPDHEARLEVDLGPAAGLRFRVEDESGDLIPCKVQILGTNGTASPRLGPPHRAHGCLDQYHSERGDFAVAVPPGQYHVVVTRGPEYGHAARSVSVAPGQEAVVAVRLPRQVSTRGWISADFHSHSTLSGDSLCGLEDRLINLAAEHIEFAPATEHNRLADWSPAIERLGLKDRLATVTGIELTGPGAHWNAFPFEPEPGVAEGGAPRWSKDPRVSALTLREFQGPNPDRWVQWNHPDLIEGLFDRNGDGEADGGYSGLIAMGDGMEAAGLGILATSPYAIDRAPNGREIVVTQREFVWLQLLNQGHRWVCVAVSDAHGVHDNGVGGWRSYIASPTDDPGRIDGRVISRNAKAGRVMVTTGPFLEVAAADGTEAGGTTQCRGELGLRIRVQCADWLDIDRVQVLVNGRPRPDLNFTRRSHPEAFRPGAVRFEREVGVKLDQDAHLIVVACGENSTLKTGFGTSGPGAWRPCAYHNPIYVDVDGGGFKASGDTLGWGLPVRRIDVEEVRRWNARGGPDHSAAR